MPTSYLHHPSALYLNKSLEVQGLSELVKSSKEDRFDGSATDELIVSYEFEGSQARYTADLVEEETRRNKNTHLRHSDRDGFKKAYDPVTDTSSRFDSILDMYADWGSEGEEDEEVRPDDADVQASVPWDTRGRTGLYGGGGRGADDRETGWVQDYEIKRHTSGREEERMPADVLNELTRASRYPGALYGSHSPRHPQRPHSTSSDYSSPPSSSSSLGSDNLVDSFLPLRNDQHQKDDYLRTPVAQSVALLASLTPPPAPRAAAAPKAVRFDSTPSPNKSASPLPVFVAGKSQGFRNLKKRLSLSPPLQRPIISDPLPTDKPFPVPVVAGSEDLAKGSSFKWTTKAKKVPVISEPILPAGFVESLGMSTFSIPRPASTSAVSTKPRKSTTILEPRNPRTSLPAAFPLLPAHKIKANPAALALSGLSPLGALRHERETEREFHRDLAEAFRQISTDSTLSEHSNDSQSEYAPSVESVEDIRQGFLDALHGDRSKDVVAGATAPLRTTAPLQPRSANIARPNPHSPPIFTANALGPLSNSSADAIDLYAFIETEPLRSSRSGSRDTDVTTESILSTCPDTSLVSFSEKGEAMDRRLASPSTTSPPIASSFRSSSSTSTPPRRISDTPPPLVLSRRPSHDYRKSMSPEGVWNGAGRPAEMASTAGTPVFRNPFASTSPSSNGLSPSPPVSGGWQPGW